MQRSIRTLTFLRLPNRILNINCIHLIEKKNDNTYKILTNDNNQSIIHEDHEEFDYIKAFYEKYPRIFESTPIVNPRETKNNKQNKETNEKKYKIPKYAPI